MGNCCSGTEKDGDIGKSNIKPSSPVRENAFILKDYQTKLVPDSFAKMSPTEKTHLLADALNLLVHHGDLSRIKPSNPHLKELLKPVHLKFKIDGDQYEGPTIEGVANGRGKVLYNDGSLTEGVMGNGMFQGLATFSYPSDPQGLVGTETFVNGLAEGLVEEKDGETRIYYLAEKSVIQGAEYSVSKDNRTFCYRKKEEKDGLEVVIPNGANKIILTEYREGKVTSGPKDFILDPSIKVPKPQQPAPVAAPQPADHPQPKETAQAPGAQAK